MSASVSQMFVSSLAACILISGCRGFSSSTPPTLLRSGQAASGSPGTGYNGVTQHGVPPSGTSGTGHSGTHHTGPQTTGGTGYNGAAQHGDPPSGTSGTGHSGPQTTGGDAPWRLIVGGRYNGMYTNDKPVSSSAGGNQQANTNGQSMVNGYAGGPASMGYQGTHANGQRVSYSNGILNGLNPLQGHTGNVPLGIYPNGQPRTSNNVFQQNLQLLGNILPALYANKQGTSYTRPYQTGMRINDQTAASRVGSYTNAHSQPSGASPQSSPAGSSTNGSSAPAASNSTATPPTQSETYNATRVAALIKALVAPSAPLLPYAVVDPIPYGAARLPGQQAPVELVGPRQQTVPATANSLTKLGRALLSGYVQGSPPKAPAAAPPMPAYNPSYTTSKSLGANMINSPQQSSLYGPLGSVAVPGNQLNTINPSRLAQLRSLSAFQLQQTIMMKLIDVGAKIKAAKSLDCKTVASLKGRRGRTPRSMSCDDDTCPVSMSCKMVFHVAFCCPQGVTYSMIQREAQNEITNILYDN